MQNLSIKNEMMTKIYEQIVGAEKAFYPSGGQLTTRAIGYKVITTLSEWIFDEDLGKEMAVPRAHYRVHLDADHNQPESVEKMDETDLPEDFEAGIIILDITLFTSEDDDQETHLAEFKYNKEQPNGLVMKCECGECNQSLSRIDLPPITVKHIDALAYAYSKRVIQLNHLFGRASLVHNDDMIFAVIYEYADEDEVTRAEDICGGFYELGKLFYEQQSEARNIQYYPIDQAA